MSLRARLVLLGISLLVLASSAAALGAVLVHRADADRRLHGDLAAAAADAENLELSYIGQAASIRAYFLTGDTAAFDEYNNQRFTAIDESGRIQGRLLNSPKQLARMRALTAAARAWRNDAIVPLIALKDQGRTDEVIERYRNGPAVSTYDKLADSVRDLRHSLRDAVQRTGKREDVSRHRVAQFAVGSVAAAVVVLASLWVIAQLWITRPMRRLAAAVRSPDVSPDDLPRRGAAELAELRAAFGDVRARLDEEIELTSRTREGLSQNAAVLMSLRAQLEIAPGKLPSGWSVAAQLVPAKGIVAGDCYNIDLVGPNEMTIVVVDVAGHGASSAIVALRAQELLRAAVRSYDDPRDAVTWASAQLTDLDLDMFVTAFVARVDLQTGLVRFVNAGHPGPFVCDGVNVVELAPTGPLIGPFAGEWYTRQAIVGPGQMLVSFTDGLIEVRDERRDEFGPERLLAVLRDNYGDDPESVLKACLNDVDAFGLGRAHDDITLMVLARAIAS